MIEFTSNETRKLKNLVGVKNPHNIYVSGDLGGGTLSIKGRPQEAIEDDLDFVNIIDDITEVGYYEMRLFSYHEVIIELDGATDPDVYVILSANEIYHS